MSDTGPILEINMNVREAQCSLCGEWTEIRWGVPTYNGDLVSNDFPDWLWREGGGSEAACRRCHDLHAAGKLTTYDRCYRHLMGGFTDGAGI